MHDIEYIALFFEAVRKSTDLADGLTQVFEENKGVLLSGRDANSPQRKKWRLLGTKSHFHEETKVAPGPGSTLAWSLGQPRHLFVFGFHAGATWTRESSASGRVEVKVGVGASWDGIRGAVAPNAGVSQGSGTARHCLRAAAPNQALRGAGQARPAASIHTCALKVRILFSRPPPQRGSRLSCACGGKNISRSSGQAIS